MYLMAPLFVVRLSEGFSESICNDLQEFLNRHVHLFSLAT